MTLAGRKMTPCKIVSSARRKTPSLSISFKIYPLAPAAIHSITMSRPAYAESIMARVSIPLERMYLRTSNPDFWSFRSMSKKAKSKHIVSISATASSKEAACSICAVGSLM